MAEWRNSGMGRLMDGDLGPFLGLSNTELA